MGVQKTDFLCPRLLGPSGNGEHHRSLPTWRSTSRKCRSRTEAGQNHIPSARGTRDSTRKSKRPSRTSLWPKGVRLSRGRLFQGDKLFVPSRIEEEYLIAEHERRHIATDKLATDVGRRAEIVGLHDKLAKVRPHCQACQAVTPSNLTPPGSMESFPVPEHPMSSICSDIFFASGGEKMGQNSS